MDNKCNPEPEQIRALQIHDAVEEMKGASSDYLTVVVEGREIPRLRMKDRADTGNGMISLQLDGRFEADFPAEYAPTAAWMIANALAIGSGYACLSSKTKEQPFAPEVRGLPSSFFGATP